jgi:hypothetical protein
MSYATVDEKARICLTKEIADRYGRRFVIVPAKGEVILVPVSEDPIKALQEEGKKIPKGLSISDIKRMARERGKKEALGNLRKR